METVTVETLAPLAGTAPVGDTEQETPGAEPSGVQENATG